MITNVQDFLKSIILFATNTRIFCALVAAILNLFLLQLRQCVLDPCPASLNIFNAVGE